MSLTVLQLTEVPQLQTRFLAGGGGADRAILWAHTCEAPEPWQWLGTGDLLLTDGYGFPHGAEEQIAFLRHLVAGNLSGMVIGEGMGAAPLTRPAAAVADELSFPVLQTAYTVPFVAIARTVADSNTHDISRRLHKILRVYDVLRRASTGDPQGHSTLLGRLARETETRMCVVDVSTASLPLGQGDVGSEVIDAVVAELLNRETPFPAISRIRSGTIRAMVLPLNDRSRTVLVALPERPETIPDLVILQHVVTIIATEVERRSAILLRRRVAGSRLFSQFIEGTVRGPEAAQRLADLGMAEGPWAVVAAGLPDDDGDADLCLTRLAHARCPHLTLSMSGCAYLLVRAADEQRVLDMCATSTSTTDQVPIGVSSEVLMCARVGDAVREARWAAEAARVDGRGVVRYGDQTPMFLPATLAEGEAVVSRVLGPLQTHDAATDSELARTLGAYFDANRSPQRAADALGVHKQTVIYRLKRIEQITGRDLHDLQDLTDLFLAWRTWRMLRSGDAMRSAS